MAFEINQFAIGAVKKLMGAGFSSILRRRFDSSKCKAEARMAMARIKLLQNKREAQVRQMRRDVALLLESGRDETARIRYW
ncbi:IST1-like protein [Zingiber officinale]|uniref:IST1-like protein n=1 Tax=Zingiber officinale TaxID=94328 RepID=UPI001C4BA303|nr:IST1-like protein [Zingiber officinale]